MWQSNNIVIRQLGNFATIVKKVFTLTLLLLFTTIGLNAFDCCVRGSTPWLEMIRVGVPILPALSPPLNSTFPQPISGYQPNPDMGWQNTYQQESRFAETVAYTRFNWDSIHIAPNRYDWQELEKLQATANAVGGKFSFRIRPARPPQWGTGEAMPAWVEARGAPIFEDSRGTEPLYHSCVYLQYQAELVQALQAKYDGDPTLSFIDVGSYGQYGEWWTDQYNPTRGSLDWHARRRIVDMYLGGSGNRPCLDAFGRETKLSYSYGGFQQTQLIMPYTPWFADSLIYAMEQRTDVGIRHDSLGSVRHQRQYEDEIGDIVAQRWLTAPIVFEFSRHAANEGGLETAYQFANQMHTSILHDNLGGNGEDAGIQRILDRIGYQITIQEITYRSPAIAGKLFSLIIHLQNNGIAPPYRTYPLQIQLMNETGAVVVEQTTPMDTHRWLPDKEIAWRVDMILPAELPAGNYRINLTFIDPLTNLPAFQVANSGLDEQGWMPAGEVEVR